MECRNTSPSKARFKSLGSGMTLTVYLVLFFLEQNVPWTYQYRNVKVTKRERDYKDVFLCDKRSWKPLLERSSSPHLFVFKKLVIRVIRYLHMYMDNVDISEPLGTSRAFIHEVCYVVFRLKIFLERLRRSDKDCSKTALQTFGSATSLSKRASLHQILCPRFFWCLIGLVKAVKSLWKKSMTSCFSL